MNNALNKDLLWLQQYGNSNPTSFNQPKNSSFKQFVFKSALYLFLSIIAVTLPFLVLIKVALYLNTQHQINSWLALFIGGSLSIIILTTYLLFLFKRVKWRKNTLKAGFLTSLLVVLSFCLYATFYLSSINSKNESVRNTYQSLHPVLRVAIATSSLADKNLVVTDIKRTQNDYRKMGLPTNYNSLHYSQKDGFVHAIDLRTNNRSEARNFILESSLKLMGFNTLRHIGTADHLHISVP